MPYPASTGGGLYCGYLGSEMPPAPPLSMPYPPAAGVGMSWSQSHAMYPPGGYPPPAGYQQPLPPHHTGVPYGYNPAVVPGHVPPFPPLQPAGYYNPHVLAPPLPPAPHPNSRHNYHNSTSKRGR